MIYDRPGVGWHKGICYWYCYFGEFGAGFSCMDISLVSFGVLV
jgi:hypothetical protein